jgi:anti-sigma-K factor RskA
VNIKEYIESGVVENYVLGLASKTEQQEFESLCSQYPELIQAKRAFELVLEAQMIKDAMTLPAGLKNKILLSLNIPGEYSLHKQKEYHTPVRKLNIWKLMAAACILLLAGSIYFNYSIRNNYQKLQITNIELKNRFINSGNTNGIVALTPIVQKPFIKWSTMVEPANSSHCMAHIFWDSLSTNTFLLIGNIPQSVSDKQFQLWALMDNQPINLGVFDSKKEGQLIQMANVHKAKVFAITMEQKGGSLTPTMEALYAIGKL